MSIKRSVLESKWYYRIVRLALFEVLPLLIVIGGVSVLYPEISSKSLDDILAMLRSGDLVIAISPVLLRPAAYLLVLHGIWWACFYVVFGGVEDDTKPKVIVTAPVAGQTGQPTVAQDGSAVVVNYLKEAEQKKGDAVTWIILIAILIWAFYNMSTPSSYPTGTTEGGTRTTTCIPTGCGSNWHCSGSYYSNNVQRSISGCYTSNQSSLPSWSGICRRCP
jgi:hypothetical protein